MKANDTDICLRIITHNIRYATNDPFKGEKPWHIRRPHLCAELVYNSLHPETTFICLQEVLHQQLQDVLEALISPAEKTDSETWSYIGVGRDDGKQAGEYSPIFYRTAVWKLEDWKNVWLSEHPDRPSKGWDAASIRIVTIGIFTHRETHRKVIMMNTHLDDQGRQARAESAKMILKLVKKYQVSPGYSSKELLLPCYLAGDFNSPPDDEAYKIMISKDSGMVDVGDCIPDEKKYGHEMTFTSFGESNVQKSRIDFVFGSKAVEFAVKTFAVLQNVFDNGVYLSDHRAVVTDLVV